MEECNIATSSVSAPPPFSIHRGAVEAWFKEASVKDPDKLVRIILTLSSLRFRKEMKKPLTRLDCELEEISI